MLWPRKRAEKALDAGRDSVEPGALPVALDAMLFKLHFGKLVETAAQDGGIEDYLAALATKRDGFAATLAPERTQQLDLSDIEALLDRVFPARRRIFPSLEALGQAKAVQLVSELVHGTAAVGARMQSFVDAMPGAAGTDRDSMKAAAKVRRAAWDFAAELVHFSDPARHPLMTRWVWDRNTQSGALREFIRGNDTMAEIPLTNDPRHFEAGRAWLAERIAAEGIYRDVELWIDLTLAQAYTGYFRAMADGSLGVDFGRGAPEHQQLKRLLGIDARAANARSRVRKAGI